MKQKTTYFKVGLFVLLCAAGLVVGLLYVGADTLRGEVVRVETYIDESVQGLSVGSTVLHRGVNIGRVERISFVQAEYPMAPDSPEFQRFGRYVMVVMALDPRRFPGLDRDPAMVTAMLRNQVSLGLRFKLSYQGITGLSFIEADYVDPVRNPELHVPWIPHNIYISSTPSLFTSFTHAIENVFLRLERIDFEALIARITDTFETIQITLHDADVARIRQSLVALIDDIQQTNRHIQSLLEPTDEPMPGNIPQAVAAFSGTLEEFQMRLRDADVTEIRQGMVTLLDEIKQTNRHIQSLLEQTDEPMPGNIPQAVAAFSTTLTRIDDLLARHDMDVDAVIANLKILVHNLRQISENIKDNPARMLFAAPPERSERVQ